MLYRITDQPCPKVGIGYRNRIYPMLMTNVGYAHHFDELKAGQRLVCLSNRTKSFVGQVSRYLKSRGIPFTRVVERSSCHDGFGGVWWMNEESERALNSAPEPTKMLQVRRPRFGQQKEKKPPFKLYEQKPNGKIETVLNGWWFN